MSERPDPRRGWWRVAIGLAVLVIGFAISFGRSVITGSAASEIGYDDVSYALAGDSRAAHLLNEGLVGFARNLVGEPPHGPVSELIATAAVAIGGPSTTRLYFINALIMAALVVVLVRVVLRTGWAVSLAAAGVALATPLGFFVIDQFRPDLPFAIVLGILTGVSAAFATTPGVDGTRRWIACGIGASALLYVKPSVFVLTAAVVVALALWSIASYRPPRAGVRARLKGLGLAIAAFLILSIPFFVVLLPKEIEYVWVNMLGENASIWSNTDPWSAVSESMMLAIGVGDWTIDLAILGLAVSLAMAAVLRTPRALHRASAFFLVGVVAMGPVAMTRGVGVFFGFVPVLILILGCIVAFEDVVVRGWWLPRWARRSDWRAGALPNVTGNPWAVLASALAIVVLAGDWSASTFPSPAGRRAPIALNERLLTAALERCQQDPICDAEYTSLGALPPILVSFAAEVTPATVKWKARESGWQGDILQLPFQVSPSEALAATDDARFVVTLGPLADYVDVRLPANQSQADLIEYLERIPLVGGDRCPGRRWALTVSSRWWVLPAPDFPHVARSGTTQSRRGQEDRDHRRPDRRGRCPNADAHL